MQGEAVRTAPAAAVVVAIDSSGSGRAALSWAAGYASTTGADLSVVHVHHHEIAAPPARSPDGGRTPEEKATEVSIGALVVAILGEPVTVTFLRGFVGREVVRFAERASLLVVGTGEHRGVERILVSSVSHYCLNHAPCPVVAVPAPATELPRGDLATAPGEAVPL